MQEATNKIFQLFQKGTTVLNRAKESAYLIIGVTRVGKSCLYNHLRSKRMIGQIDPIDKQNIILKPYPHQGESLESYAQMSANMDSLTLVPNVTDLDGQTSLVDLAGFEQNRDEIQVLAVSYFFDNCFRKLNRIKFMLTFTEDELLSPRNHWTSTLNKFLNLFSAQQIERSSWKQNFLKSISLVVTRSVQTPVYLRQRLFTILGQLMKQNTMRNQANKPLFIEVFKMVAEKNRIQCFQQARYQQVIQKNEIIGRLNSKGWQFFNLKKARSQLHSQFSAQLSKNYQNLSQLQKERLDEAITRQVNCLIKLNLIFEAAFKSLDEDLLIKPEWNQTLFHFFQNLLEQSYPYRSKDDSSCSSNSQLDIISVILKVLQLFDLSSWLQQFQKPSVKFQAKMNKKKQIYVQMVEGLQPLCASQRHRNLLKQLKNRFRAEIQLFITIYEWNPHSINDIDVKMACYNNLYIFCVPKLQFLANFIKKLNSQTIQKYFKDEKSLGKLKEIVQKYRLMIKQCNQQQEYNCQLFKESFQEREIKLHLLNSDIISAKINILSAKKDQKIISEYCEFIQVLHSFSVFISKSNVPSSEKQVLATKNFHKTIQALNSFIQVLLQLHFAINCDFRFFAVELSQITQNTYLSEKIFESLLKQSNQNDQRTICTLTNYAKWCKKWGKMQQARKQLLHKLQLLQRRKVVSIPKLKELEAQLRGLQDQSLANDAYYRAHLGKLCAIFSSQQWATLRAVIKRIQQSIKSSFLEKKQ